MSLRDLLRQLARIAKVLHALAEELDAIVARNLPATGAPDPGTLPGGPPDATPPPSP